MVESCPGRVLTALGYRVYLLVTCCLVLIDQPPQMNFISRKLPVCPLHLLLTKNARQVSQFFAYQLENTRQSPAFLRVTAFSNGFCTMRSDTDGDVVQR